MKEALFSASLALPVPPTQAIARSMSRTDLPGNVSWQKRSNDGARNRSAAVAL